MKWEQHFKESVAVESQVGWIWALDSLPIECENLNICLGSSLRDEGRRCLIVDKFELIDIIAESDFVFLNFKTFLSRETIVAYNNIEQIYDFIELLEKEDNKTITPKDYSSYLEKYPDAYYKQYCIDGYAMAKADTFTLDTPKDEIKKLLDSGITKGAAKYVKMVTKKSYLKSKSL